MSGVERASTDGVTSGSVSLGASEVLAVLEHGEVELVGRLPYSSNYVFLVQVTDESASLPAVYKPTRGERPLWDFRRGSLAAREVAAYLAADAGGFGFVPPTVLRDDAPLGAGSLQLFIEHDPNRHYFVLVEEREEDFPPLAAFDVAINNADRKAGHVLQDARGELWAVDHGLAFNAEDKLRTVVWDFAGDAIQDDVKDKLLKLRAALLTGRLGPRLGELLSPQEVRAAAVRIDGLLASGCFPVPDSQYRLPWPLI